MSPRTKKPKEKVPIGRPPKFASVQDMENRIELYFAECEGKGRPYTMSGLALALGTTRSLLLRYEYKAGFDRVIERAKEKVQNYAEEMLFSSKQVAGIIFNLKNNFGWADQQVIDFKGQVIMQVVSKVPEPKRLPEEPLSDDRLLEPGDKG